MKTNKSVSCSRQPIKSGLMQNNLSDEELKAEFLRTRGATVCPKRKSANPRLKLATPKLFIPAAKAADPCASAEEISAFNKRKSRRYGDRELKRMEKKSRSQAAKAETRRRRKPVNQEIAKLNAIAAKLAEVNKRT